MKTYECSSCGILTKDAQEICHAQESAFTCQSFTTGDSAARDCRPMETRILFACEFCGRDTTSPHLVCSPEQRE